MPDKGISNTGEADKVDRSMTYLIVGIDPGTKTGIALLDLNGKVVELFSSKDMGVNKTVEYVASNGNSSIIASDVSRTPHFISKVASKLGCPLSIPKESLSQVEKNNITDGYTMRDSHQRDALAAALTTFNKYKNQFRKIDTLNLGDEVKHRVLRGMRVIPQQTRSPKPKKVKNTPNWPEDTLILRRRYTALKEELKLKEKEIEDLMGKIERIKGEYNFKLNRDSEILERDEIIKRQRYKMGELQRKFNSTLAITELWEKIVDKSIIPVAVFPSHNDGLTLIKKKLKKKDYDLLNNVTVAFTNEPINKQLLRNKGIYVGDFGCLNGIEGCYFITQGDFQKIMEKKQISLEKIVEDYRKGD